jgi:hypothetical protein
MDNDPTQLDLERPDEYQEIGDEVYCWLPGNYDRECNGSCVAFDTIFETDQRRSQCSIINLVKSVALSHAKIANVENTKARIAVVPNQSPPEVR